MLVHPQFDPVALQLGPFAVRWYGLMYLIGFALIWAAGRWRIARRPDGVWSAKDLDDALFYGILGTLLGGDTVAKHRVDFFTDDARCAV